MKKRVIPILIALAALISLLILPANAAETSSVMRAGYHKITIDPYNYPDGPLNGLPMGGYGAVTERLSGTKPDTVGEGKTIAFNSDARMDDNGDGKIDSNDGLFATCTAITDKNGNTIIHYGVDNTNAATGWTNKARVAIANELKSKGYSVNINNIFITASHSHSTPQLDYSSDSYPEITEKVTKYRNWVISQMATAAVKAMEDREEVNITKASVDASDAIGAMYSRASSKQKRMNWVRHYTSTESDSTIVGGSNFGGYGSSIKEVSSPNDVMQLVMFTPVSGTKNPILLVNWTAHSTMNSSGGSSGYSTSTFGRYHHYNTSADYPGALRSALENATCYDSTIKSNYFSKVSSTQKYRVSFISGAAGNVTPSTSIMTSSQDPDVLATDTTVGYEKDPAGHLYGQKLAAVVRYGLANKMSASLDNTGDIRVQTKTFTYDIQKASDFDTAFVNALKSYMVDASGNITTDEAAATKNLLSYLVTNSNTWSHKGDSKYTNLTYTYNNTTYDFTYLNKFTSRYQLSNMNGRVTDSRTTGSMSVSAITIGKNLAITVNPCELADRFSETATLSATTENDWNDLVDNSTYGTPLIMGYTNGGEGYVPNKLAYNYNSGRTSSGGDGADYNDKYITGSYESSGAKYAAGTGEKLIDFYGTMLSELKNGTPATDVRVQCECGGKAVGVADHVCSEVEFLPWTESTSLPAGGNYYLTTDVTLTEQLTLLNILTLDLNGHSITSKVSAEEGQKALDKKNNPEDKTLPSYDTRVFSLSGGALVTITDSTANPGKITRDLSALTEEQKAAITNWGLLFLVNDGTSVTLYNGTLDASGQYSGGGSCISLQSKNTAFTMYGGALKGGISDSGSVYIAGDAAFYGGTVTGGVTKNAAGLCSGLYVVSDGTLTIGGSVVIKDNKKSNGNPINIRFSSESKMATNFTVKGAFTGEAGFYYGGTRTNGLVVGKSENASFTTANLHQDVNKDYAVAVSGDDIILATIKNQCECGGKASGKTGHTCKKIDFLPWTSTTSLPTSGNYYLTDHVTTSAQTNIGGTVHLDLNGKTVTCKVSASEGAKAEAGTSHNTRAISVAGGGYLSITDSTSAMGTITRDLSNLTDTQKSKITNYGLILLIGNGASATVYNGHLDATGSQTTGGGACVSNNYAGSVFTMYGGMLTGSNAGDAGVLYNKGTATIYGGTFTGGKADNGGFAYNIGSLSIFGGTITDNRTVNNGTCPGIYCSTDGSVTIGGNAQFSENRKYNSNGTTAMGVLIDLRFASPAKMATNFTVKGAFTGTINVYISSGRTNGFVVGKSDNASFTSANITEAYYDEKYEIILDGDKIVLAGAKTQCECGGKASGKYGHTCENITWTPWSDRTALPTDAGNYYLTTDIVTTAQKTVSKAIRIDLNGHDITHKVTAGSKNTRVFSIAAGGSLVITDSTATPGKVTRDLSNLTTEQKEAITNYGLIVMIGTSTECGGFTLYNGTLDATGAYTYGGAVACLNSVSPVKIYGGTINGGIANSGSTDTSSGFSGGIFTWAPLEIHGGTITGSTATRTTGGGGVYFTKSLLLTGDPTITGNVDSTGKAYNVCSASASKITVSGTFTGTVGFSAASPASGVQIAKSSSANISGATLTIDNQPAYALSVSGSYLVMNSAYKASVTSGSNVTFLDSLTEAIEAYPGGEAVLTVLQDSSENVTFTKDTILDLNGCDLTGTVKADGKLTVMDSQTDDLTVNDAQGYGTIPSTLSADAADGYIKITEDGDTSFHKLVLATVGVNLRSSATGIYYTSDFGGDEVIKRNLKSFGVALGANKEPDFDPKTYTEFSSTSWTVGINADGSTKNRTNGTILQDILVDGQGYSSNSYNASLPVWSVAYIELLDGTRITEDHTVKFSLRNIIEGYTGFNGVDDLWSTLSATQKNEAIDMYLTYENVMRNWDIPNIKQGLVDQQDDGVLKVLVVGHSLGIDASYFTPMVAHENGTEMVLGTLYHSGCTLKQHEDYINRNVTEYAYLEYDNRTDTSWRIWENSIGANGFVQHTPGQAHDTYIGTGSDDKYGVTMKFAIQQHDWDIIIMMAGSTEATGSGLDVTDVGVIRNYILGNDLNNLTTPKFAWNMTWSYPESTTVHGNDRTDAMNTLMNSYNNDSDAMFEAIANTVETKILKNYSFDYLLPNGTAVQNMKAAGLTDEEIYRDRVHASDYTRLLAACNWYCGLTGKNVADITVPDVPANLRYKAADRNTGDYKLQADEKSLIKSCVSNALANPYEITEIANDDVFKVLVIGHSTGMDPVYYMPAIAKANGQKMLVGDLYHSGCSLAQHDSYIKNNSKEYAYLEYDNSTDTAWRIWETEEGSNGFVTHKPNQAHDSYIGAAATKAGNPNKYGVTMEWAIKQHDWDLIIMMGGRWECADITVPGSEMDITDIGAICSHVLTNDINKTTIPAFAWNSLWTVPEYDEEWMGTLTDSWRSSYESRWATVTKYYQGSTQVLYESTVRGLQNIILPEYSFDHLIHNSTLIQNAKNSGLTNYDIYRDYGHCTDYIRAMSATNWYCSITGADVSTITIPDFQAELRFKTADRNSGEPFVLTENQKAQIVELVGNTINNPYEVTK